MTLTKEEIRLLEALLDHCSETTAQKAGLYVVEAEKSADSQVYARLYQYAKQIGMTPTPERINSLFNHLAKKGSK